MPTATWVGTTNNNWGTGTNWSPQGVPNGNPDVVIQGSSSSTTVNIASGGNYTVATVTLGSSSATNTATLNNAGTLNAYSAFSITQGATFSDSGTSTLANLSLAQGGTLQTNATGQTTISTSNTLNGAIIDNGKLSANSAITIGTTGSVAVGSSATATFGQSLTVNGSVTDSGTLNVNGNTTVNTGASFTIATGGNATLSNPLTVNGTVTANGTLNGNSVTVSTTGNMTIGSGVTATFGSGMTVNGNGQMTVSGTAAVGSSIAGTGTITVNGGSVTGTNGNAAQFASNATNHVLLENGGSMALANAPPKNVEFDFGPNNTTTPNTLKLPASVNITSLITGFGPGDLITTGQSVTGTITQNTGTGTPTYTIKIGNVTLSNVQLAPGVTPSDIVFHADGSASVCFVEGTLIRTDRGEVAVEDLKVGDLVVTKSGALSQICWIGSRRVDLATQPQPELIAPIRVSRGAIADNVPARDLLVSPDHGVFVDGALIPAHHLVNGTTIAQDFSRRTFRYFHVELESHDILLAEGLTAESYLDTGNRNWFAAQGAVAVLRPDDLPTSYIEVMSQPREGGMAMTTDAALVEPIWQRLYDRAAMLGKFAASVQTTEEPMLRLQVDGREISPIWVDGSDYLFPLDLRAESVRLISRAARVSDLAPWSGDRRTLGVAVAGIAIYAGNQSQAIPLDSASAYGEGWWSLEQQGRKSWRWTNGNAVVRLEGAGSQSGFLSVQVHSTVPYRVEDASEQAWPAPRSAA